jgi:hypothetical protein
MSKGEPDLPNVPAKRFLLTQEGLFYIDDEGQEHEVVKFSIVANGMRDLCVVWKGLKAGDVTIAKIADVDPKHVLWFPKGDLIWMRIEPPLRDRHSLIVDVESDVEIKKLVREIVQRFKVKKGPDYHMYGGESY